MSRQIGQRSAQAVELPFGHGQCLWAVATLQRFVLQQIGRCGGSMAVTGGADQRVLH
ncbi:MAG: hypothetical protein AAFN68_11710 [Pseudomonadota bacterium]